MPAYQRLRPISRPRERAYALAAVVVVQLALAFGLLTGLRVDLVRPGEAIAHLINLELERPAPPRPPVVAEKVDEKRQEAAPKATRKDPGGFPGPRPAEQVPSVTPLVAVHPAAPPAGGGTGNGPALGGGAGGGSGGAGNGDDGGGTELEQIAGEITPRDYPRHLGRAGIGGRVGLLFTVGVTGRVTRCTVTSSSGIPELDALTCRLIQQRFLFRPGTDRYGRPVSDDVEGEHVWEAR